jgi:hypothetical protein
LLFPSAKSFFCYLLCTIVITCSWYCFIGSWYLFDINLFHSSENIYSEEYIFKI